MLITWHFTGDLSSVFYKKVYSSEKTKYFSDTELHVPPKGVGWVFFFPKLAIKTKLLNLYRRQRVGELICIYWFTRCLCGLRFKRENNGIL